MKIERHFNFPYLCTFFVTVFLVSGCFPSHPSPSQSSAVHAGKPTSTQVGAEESPNLVDVWIVYLVDAESGDPIRGGQVDLHPFPSSPTEPQLDHPAATSDESGMVQLPRLNQPTIWQIRADGYIEQQVATNEPEHGVPYVYAFHATARANAVIHIYKGPMPELTITVPDGYTGLLTINFLPAPGFDYVSPDALNTIFAPVASTANYGVDPYGERTFNVNASAGGEVKLNVTPLLFGLTTDQIIVEDSGTTLPTYEEIPSAPEDGRALLGSIDQSGKQMSGQSILFVGTPRDYRKYRGFE